MAPLITALNSATTPAPAVDVDIGNNTSIKWMCDSEEVIINATLDDDNAVTTLSYLSELLQAFMRGYYGSLARERPSSPSRDVMNNWIARGVTTPTMPYFDKRHGGIPGISLPLLIHDVAVFNALCTIHSGLSPTDIAKAATPSQLRPLRFVYHESIYKIHENETVTVNLNAHDLDVFTTGVFASIRHFLSEVATCAWFEAPLPLHVIIKISGMLDIENSLKDATLPDFLAGDNEHYAYLFHIRPFGTPIIRNRITWEDGKVPSAVSIEDRLHIVIVPST